MLESILGMQKMLSGAGKDAGRANTKQWLKASERTWAICWLSISALNCIGSIFGPLTPSREYSVNSGVSNMAAEHSPTVMPAIGQYSESTTGKTTYGKERTYGNQANAKIDARIDRWKKQRKSTITTTYGQKSKKEITHSRRSNLQEYTIAAIFAQFKECFASAALNFSNGTTVRLKKARD